MSAVWWRTVWYLDTLDDPKLRREILIQKPKNFGYRFVNASRLEAYDREMSDDQEVNGREEQAHSSSEDAETSE